MAEQSHKQEMNEAVRGDFERLRARQEHAPPSLGPVLEASAQASVQSASEARVVLTRPPEPVEAAPPSPAPRAEPEHERRRFGFLRRR